MTNYIGGKEASNILGVHQRTLYIWDRKGLIETIRTPGNKRLYNVSKFMEDKKCKNKICNNLDDLDNEKRLNIAYVRVSSVGQKDDLQRQKDEMKKKYPNHIIIEEIGSGLNLNKRGIKKIIHLGIAGKINELVVAHKDRLTRFGFELIEEIITKYSNGKIIIISEPEKLEPEEEIVKDVMSILNVYVAKINGMRKYKHKENHE